MKKISYKRRLKQKARALVFPLSLPLFLFSSAASWAEKAQEPAQSPLVIQTTFAEPNIMFLFDDSTSMVAMTAPDSFGDSFVAGYYKETYHPGDTYFTYGSLNAWGKYMLPTNYDDGVARMVRSPQINKLYYNPATTYRPWKNADGSWVYNASNNGNLDPTKVPVSILQPNLATVNLTGKDIPASANYQVGYCMAVAGTVRSGCSNNGKNYTYTPAVYFIYTPGNVNWGKIVGTIFSDTTHPVAQQSNYQQVIIEDIPDSGIIQNGSRTDCAQKNSDGTVTCTKAEEMQNFANWFGYYRGRTRAAIGSVLRSFDDYDAGFRLGWSALGTSGKTIDGVYASKYLAQGVRSLDVRHKTDFYNWVMNYEKSTRMGSTPLHGALQAVGEYYKRADSKGPWGSWPGVGQSAAGITESSSEQSSCRKNYLILVTDGEWNSTIVNYGNVDGTSGPIHQKPDGSTGGYVAEPPFSDNNSGTLADLAMYYWKNDLREDLDNDLVPTTQDPAFWQHMVTHTIGMGMSGNLDFPEDQSKINDKSVVWTTNKTDDLWHTAVNGHGTYNSAASVDDLVKSLSGILQNVQEEQTTLAYSVTTTDYIEVGNRAFVTSYVSGLWTGELERYKLKSSGVTVSSPDWKASDGIPAPAVRNIWIGTGVTDDAVVENNKKIVEFKWEPISSYAALAGGLVDTDMVNYLRGETNSAYRTRGKLLGDIVNSQPLFVKQTNYLKYNLLPSDATSGMGGYLSFYNDTASREGMIFIGANDGMLHAFANEGTNEGKEVFAFIPNSVASNLKTLADLSYETKHRYYVDGPLNSTDTYWGTCSIADAKDCWHTVLMGSTGAGAKAVFALDITDPSVYAAYGASTSQDNAEKTFLWELTPSSPNMGNLGNVLQPLQAGYAANKTWVAVFGNGAYGARGAASLFLVDLKTGDFVAEVKTDESLVNNGLMGVSLIYDDKQVITGAYAGDLRGNLWRFDLSSSDTSDWKAKKIFTTENNRPITAAPTYVKHPYGGNMVLLGTGKFFDTSDLTDAAINSLYGVWDQNGATFVPTNSLLEREVVAIGTSGYYTLKSNAAIDWDVYKGWKLELTMYSLQRSLYAGKVVGNNVFFSTTVIAGASDAASGCGAGNLSGMPITLDLFSGGLSSILTDTNNDGVIDSKDNYVINFPLTSEGQSTSLYAPGLNSKPADSEEAGLCSSGEVYGTYAGKSYCVKAKDRSSQVQLF